MLLLLGAAFFQDRRYGRWVLVGLLATCLTHPFVWHGIPALRAFIEAWWARAVLFEGLAVGVEGIVFAWVMRWPWGRAAVLSLVANAVSFVGGMVWSSWSS